MSTFIRCDRQLKCVNFVLRRRDLEHTVLDELRLALDPHSWQSVFVELRVINVINVCHFLKLLLQIGWILDRQQQVAGLHTFNRASDPMRLFLYLFVFYHCVQFRNRKLVNSFLSF